MNCSHRDFPSTSAEAHKAVDLRSLAKSSGRVVPSPKMCQFMKTRGVAIDYEAILKDDALRGELLDSTGAAEKWPRRKEMEGMESPCQEFLHSPFNPSYKFSALVPIPLGRLPQWHMSLFNVDFLVKIEVVSEVTDEGSKVACSMKIPALNEVIFPSRTQKTKQWAEEGRRYEAIEYQFTYSSWEQCSRSSLILNCLSPTWAAWTKISATWKMPSDEEVQIRLGDRKRKIDCELAEKGEPIRKYKRTRIFDSLIRLDCIAEE